MMKLYNYTVHSLSEFQCFAEAYGIPDSNRVLIQLFVSGKDDPEINLLLSEIKQALPNASVIGTTTAGVIADGNIIDNHVSVSVSVFDDTTTQTRSYCNQSADDIATQLQAHITSETKLAIIFANTLRFDATALLHRLSNAHPNLALAGGNAGDDFKFQKCTDPHQKFWTLS
jgi:hypothetical protein